jgi:hypothetical protein
MKQRKGKFDPEDEKHVKHSRLGVWDLYEEKNPQLAYVPGISRFEPYLEMIKSLPYVWRMIKDISGIDGCWVLLSLYLLVEVVLSLIPAMSLW